MDLPGRKIATIAVDAMVGHQLDDMTTPHQLLGQRHGGEKMTAGATGHEDKGFHSAAATTALR